MDTDDYARFLPLDVRERLTIEPVEDWWQWRGRHVHVARARRPEAAVRAMVLHGAGGHAGMLWPLASLAVGDGVDLAVPDMPLYGRTVEPHRSKVRYDDWVDLVCDLIAAEDDGRPLILFGASMGGMLAYEAAARTGRVAAVAATCFLDLRDPRSRAAAARAPWIGSLAPRVLPVVDRWAAGMQVPIRWAADMRAMSGNPELSRTCAADRLGGGGRVPIGWLASFFAYQHVRPEDFSACPVLLVHPRDDAWTPPELSQDFLGRIAAPTTSVLLDGCGHFPVEQPGLNQLESALRGILAEVS